MNNKFYPLFALAFLALFSSQAQEIDSSQIGKKYPYVLPFLGKQAYAKGYKLQLPFGIMANTVLNKQGIVLNDFSMAFTADPNEVPDFEELQPISDLIVFGPSEGEIATFSFRADAWILPFLSVGGYWGKVYGKQTITLTAPVAIESTTDIRGQYYGFNLLGIVPLGPVSLAADYSWSWTTNERLDKPVLVNVAGIRVIKRFVSNKSPDRFWAIWGGAQFQKLENQTSGKIDLDEALDLNDELLDDVDMAWDEYKMSPAWDELTAQEKVQAELKFQIVRGALEGLAETTVHYKFNKKLVYPWNMLLGANYQLNPRWQFRAEYGFLKSKQQLMVSLNYRFGF
jgi:hypothetical protein